MAMNVVALQGRLGADPEIRFLEPSGTPVAKVNIAVDIFGGRDAEGKPKRRPCWVTVKAFEKTAQLLADHWKKGDQILVAGRLDMDTWEKDGQKRTLLYVRADRLDFCGGKRGEVDSPAEREAAERAAARTAQNPAPATDPGVDYQGYPSELPPDLDDSIPF